MTASSRRRERHIAEAQQWLAKARRMTTAAGIRVCSEYALEHLDAAQELAGKATVLLPSDRKAGKQ